MAGGLRYEDIRELPEGYQHQVVVQILAKVAGKVPEESEPKESEDTCMGEICLRWYECNGVDEECPLRR